MSGPTPPDITTLTSWEQAFESYSIPQVRTLHQQLQRNLEVNREKLRALVGESYRDLLQTAEKIIETDGVMRKIENNLGDASRNCNYRLMEKKARNVKLFQERLGGRGLYSSRDKYMFTAQISVLQGCAAELSGLLHRNASCLLAARVFVVSRLVLKAFQEKETAAFPIVVSLRDQMTSLRAFLLQHIDHILRTTSLPTNTLTESMCALALVKTSSSSDLLRHFLNIRSNAISATLDSSTSDLSTVHSTLKLFHSTLLHTEAIFPKRIFNCLHQLKSKPLFENTELRNTPGLNISANERWLPEDIRGFVPWVRHDELEDGRVNDSAKAWASRELEVLNGVIKRALSQIDDVGVIVSLRKEILDSFYGSKSRLLHVVIGTQIPIQRIREQMNERLVELLGVNAIGLERIGESIEKFALRYQPDAINLWSDNLLGLPLSNGAALFRKTVQAAIVGHGSAMRFVSTEYQTWNQLITTTSRLLKGISKAEKLDEFEDDSDVFGLGLNDAQDGVEDSEKVQKSLYLSLKSAYKSLEERLEILVRACEEDPSNPHIAFRSAFLLRTIRYLRQEHHPATAPDQDTHTHIRLFAKPLTTRLQRTVAIGFSSHGLSLFQRALHRRRWSKSCPSLPLWDGSPSPLPTLPSPDVFKFLHELVSVMAKAGSDTWTPATVGHLRSVVKHKIWVIVDTEMYCRGVKATEDVGVVDNSPIPGSAGDGPEQSLGGNKTQLEGDKMEPQGEGSKEGEPSHVSESVDTGAPRQNPTISHSWAIQLLYDLLYLRFALPEDSTLSNEGKLSRLKARFNVVNGDEFERLEINAGEYWKRTSLLFSLLV